MKQFNSGERSPGHDHFQLPSTYWSNVSHLLVNEFGELTCEKELYNMVLFTS